MRDDATERQIQAADPNASTWVAANAGSGKTRVLIDRVARLLLRGVEPSRILCLTYTKAAATEMQNRLFQRLGGWAMKPDDTLRADLADLGEGPRFTGEDLAKARRLFARALETPGGLRIQTIHSFCATLLRRFPLEAKVSPGFTELDDRAARLLRAQIVEEMAEVTAPDVMADVAGIYTGEDFTQLMEQVTNARHGFAAPLSEVQAKALFGIAPTDTLAAVYADTFLGNEPQLIAELIDVMMASGTNDQKAAAKIAAVDWSTPTNQSLATLEKYLLHSDGVKDESKHHTAKLDAFPAKDARIAFAHRMDQLNALMLRVETARTRRLGLEAARKTHTLHRFAGAFLPLYNNAKAARGWLDFDDLITKAKGLLTDSSLAAWVLYRLDGGIDHILVDEAQDTSPDQWKVIELLAEEFTAGQTARSDRLRTLFVVGDKKQSIYSFQGADVAAFDEKHALFKRKFADAGQLLVPQELKYSFRSAPSILRLVDETFSNHFTKALGDNTEHIAHKEALPGRVDLWDLIPPVKTEEDKNFEDPVDLISETHHATRLANQIAAQIKDMIDQGVHIPDEKGPDRQVHAGDFLILVRRRSALFAEVIRACKAAKLPIAGADRLKLAAELAVKDLAALLSFLATPEDDLSLAALLRSPLCGWTEGELYRLAHGRKGFLWEALRDYPANSDTLLMLRDLLDSADFLRPYDLLDRALTRHKGRQRLLARLGDEAEDGIDELLSQALSYEQNDVPSLTGFLIWMETDDITVKRQMDAAGQRIRVMTVHGAKGLEAPIVILPDTADYAPPDRDEIYRLPHNPLAHNLVADDLPVWKTSADASPPLIQATRSRRKADQAAESARLLYVALTRARVWLIVAGAGEAKTETGGKNPAPKPIQDWCWYRLVEQAMKNLGAETTHGGVRRLSNGDWPEAALHDAAPDAKTTELPDWALLPSPPEGRPAQPLSPSNLGGAKALPGESQSLTEDAAKLRGTAVHLLLEHLPQTAAEGWPKTAAALIPDAALSADALAEATALLTAPHLSWVFAPDSLAEVAFTATLNGRTLSGSIDRLIVTPDRIHLIDFKSNTVVPPTPAEVPEGILRQMGAYVAALRQIYPDRPVDPHILWTRTATLMPLDPNMVSAALNRATLP